MINDRKTHWETVYATKLPEEVSWTQAVPKTSLDFINGFYSPKTASIIDVGGGDSKLVDYLLDEGYTNITVLDISVNGLQRAQTRLGAKAAKVEWIVADINEFEPTKKYDVWHDRAVFHFLTKREEITRYTTIAKQAAIGFLVIGTFSENGPKKCSGLDIAQYSEERLQEMFSEGFDKIHCTTEDHITPFNTTQNFLFCSFKNKNSK